MAYRTLDVYTDEELGRMIRSAISGREQEARRHGETRAALSAFFRLAGLGELADVMILVAYVWKRVRALFQILLGRAADA